MDGSNNTLAELDGASYLVPIEKLTTEIVDQLNSNPELAGAIIVDGSQLAGMASREAIAHCLSRPFAQELYLRKPVAELLPALPEPLVLDDTELVNNAVRLGLEREPTARYEPIVCRLSQGWYRLVSFHSLLLTQSELLASAGEIIKVQKEAAEAASEAKTQFLANMSHEIRTPLTAILGFAEELMNPDIPRTEHNEAVATILRQGDHLLEVINGILDLSKIEAGRLEIENLWHSPIDLVRDAILFLRSRAETKGLSLTLHLDSPVPERVLSDPTRLRQILINLVGNAIKFTDRGGVQLRMRFEDADDAALVFEVIDSGIGLSPEQVDKLFQPFVQADNSMTRRFGGSGLGLSICQRLAVMLGGSIRVDSKPGNGSTFAVRIDAGPVAEIERVTELPSELHVARGAFEPHVGTLSGRILLAEDTPDNQLLLSRFLKRGGASVDIAENGAIAIEFVEQAEKAGRPYDVILMDMQMPELDGYQATQQLREAGCEIPIVALTANAMDGDEQRCRDAGCSGYASKPINRKRLIEEIGRFLPEDNLRARNQSERAVPTVANSSSSSLSFDLDSATERLGGDADLLVEVLELVAAEIPKRLDQIESGIDCEDTKAFRRAVHSLKNSAENICAMEASKAAFALERRLRDGASCNDVRDDATRLAGTFSSIATEIEQYLGGGSGRSNQATQPHSVRVEG